MVVQVAPAVPESRSSLAASLRDRVANPRAMLELATWLGLLSPDGEISDYGVALRWLGERSTSRVPSSGSFLDRPDTALSTKACLLLWLLMRADTVLSALLVTGSTAPTDMGPWDLTRSVSMLISAAEDEADPDDLVPAPELRQLLARFESDPYQRAIARNVRLEMLGSLGILVRAAGTSDPPEWLDTPISESLASALLAVPLTRSGLASFLDGSFFGNLVPSWQSTPRQSVAAGSVLLYLVEAYEAIRRPLGFTPGRPLALLASILAAADGIILEIRDVFECVYGASRGRWSPFLDFSGGSRFDREFLIRIDPQLRLRLERTVDR